jgi:phage FluMu protein Com
MKVLTDNFNNKGYALPFNVTCTRCKSVLQVDDQEEVKSYVPPQMYEGMAGQRSYLYVECPLCHHHQETHPPKNIQK